MTTREALRGLARTRAKLIDAAMLVVADGKGTGMPGWRMLVAAIDEAQAADKAWNERERLEADAELIATALGAWGSDLLLPAYRRGKAVAVCNAIDTHLFGAPASDATPNEAKSEPIPAEPASDVKDSGSCPTCGGSGRVTVRFSTGQQLRETCDVCGGTGKSTGGRP